MIGNAAIESKSEWTLLRGAMVDPATSHSQDDSGAIKLVAPMPKHSMALAKLVTVKTGQRYTFGFHFKTQNGPTYVGGRISLHDKDRKYLRNLTSTWGGTTTDDSWQEYALPFVVPEGVAYVGCQVFKGPSTKEGGLVWADDFYLGTGVGLADPPSPKKAFDGQQVRVDSLGNFEIRQKGKWTPIFPMCMFSDNYRNWSVYSRQGWNTIIWTGAAHQVQQAKDAVSEFNPNGMLAGFQISQYTFPGSQYNNLNGLKSKVSEIFDKDLSDNLLFYYWDNEVNHSQWQVPVDVIKTIRTLETDVFGLQQRPIFALQGTYNNARVHASRGLVDVSGTYFGGKPDRSDGAGTKGHEALVILDRQNGQTSPAAFAQFNGVDEPGEMRLRLYNSILCGAKAMGYWRDCYKACDEKFTASVGPVDKKPWWPDFPNLRREIDALLPLIRQPHWTQWTASVDAHTRVRIGTRDFDGKAHLILVNQTSQPQQVTVKFDGLSYKPSEAWDTLKNKTITKISEGTFTITLAGISIGNGTRVVQLK